MTARSLAEDVVVPIAGRPAVPGGRCPARCRADHRARAHHDRLLAVEVDQNELVELLELAVTWQELDWSGQDVVPPQDWPDFAAEHRWADPERMARLFALAADVALRGARPAARPERALRRAGEPAPSARES